jgi:hypothetical protein
LYCYGVFKVHAGKAHPTRERRPQAGLSKLNSELDVEVDVDLGELVSRTDPKIHRRDEQPPE